METKPKLIVICGPTATGKSEIAFGLAQKLETEIISFDSVQVYKRLNIGTAKPPKEMLQKVKHHLIDAIDPAVPFTAGDFRKQALEILQKTTKKEMILVGGTGFYLQALLKGMHQIPEVLPETKMRLQKDLQVQGLSSLYEELRLRDPRYSKKIHPNDQYRVLRALELLRSSSRSVTQINEEFRSSPPFFETHQFGLRRKREILKSAMESRTGFMLEQGLVKEVQDLLKEFPQGLRPLESVGYKEVTQYLRGEIKEEDLAKRIITSTFQLAKRQATWFKRDQNISWYDPDEVGLVKIINDIAFARSLP